MPRFLTALVAAAGLAAAGPADACLFCGLFGGGMPYGAGYAPYSAGYAGGPSTFTAGYAPASYGAPAFGPTPGQVRRANRRAARRSFWGSLFSGPYAAPYGAGYAPATYSAGYAPAYGYSAGYAPAAGVAGYGAAYVPSCCEPAPACGCESGVAAPAFSAPSSCPNGNCGAGYAPPLEPIPAGGTPVDAFSVPPTYSAPADPAPTGPAPTYDDTGLPADFNTPPDLPPGASNPTDWYVKPGDEAGAIRSPGERTFDPEPEPEPDGDFRPGGGGGFRTPERGGSTFDDRDRGGPAYDDLLPEDFSRPSQPGGRDLRDEPDPFGFDGADDLDDGTIKSQKPVTGPRPVKPKASRPAGERLVGSGLSVARSRTLVRSRHSLPGRVARRYDLERGEYAAGGRVAAND